MRFFTLPPSEIAYPFVLVNGHHPQFGLRYLRKHHQDVQAVILDSGIEIFRDPMIKDYPSGHLQTLVELYYQIKQNVHEVWLVCPDYCDDYHPKNLWLSHEITNIERTVLSVIDCLDQFPEVNWLIPIQGWNQNPKSVLRCLTYYEEFGIKRNYFAVGNLCVERSTSLIIKTIRYVKRILKSEKIHVFGLNLTSAIKLRGSIYSFDSMAWTRSSKKLGRSCRNKRERIEHFMEWIKRAKIILDEEIWQFLKIQFDELVNFVWQDVPETQLKITQFI